MPISFLSSSKAVLWVKGSSFSLHTVGKNPLTFDSDLDLTSPQTEESLFELANFLTQKKLKKLSLLISDPLSGNQSFVYDSPPDKIQKNELISIAAASFPFDINNDYLSYEFGSRGDKTLIRVTALDQSRITAIIDNLRSLGVGVLGFDLLSSSLAKVFSRFWEKPFICTYALTKTDALVVLSLKSKAYLSKILPISSLKIQTIVNQSKN